MWWEANGGLVPILKRVAIRILSQTCSASACESNWSAFNAAQTKNRNRLSLDMLEDLVYIRVNSLTLKFFTNFDMHDRKTIDLENLVEFDENVNERLEEVANEGLEENAIDNIDVGDTSWLDKRLGIGSSISRSSTFDFFFNSSNKLT